MNCRIHRMQQRIFGKGSEQNFREATATLIVTLTQPICIETSANKIVIMF